MARPLRVVALAACAALALLGLALGAESQREVVLASDLEDQGDIAEGGAAGNLVLVTGALVGLGCALGACLLSKAPPPGRALATLGLWVSVHAAVAFGQSMLPFYVALVDFRQAHLATSLLVTNLPGAPSTLIAPLALTLGSLLGAGWCAAYLLRGRTGGLLSPAQLLRMQCAATLLAVPFLGIAAWGNLRLLLHLPDNEPGLGPYLVVLPAATLACLALAALAVAKAWQVGTYLRNARLAIAVQESWLTLGRIEAATLALLGGLAIAGSFLRPFALEELQLGRTFGVTLRSHTQLLFLLAIPLAPLFAANRAGARTLAQAPLHEGTLDAGTSPLAVVTVAAAVASLALGALGTWAIDRALWAWVLAALPAAGVAIALCGPRHSAPAGLLLAFLLWAVGNTVQATYNGSEGSAVLVFATPTGLLALWRTLGAVLAAAVLARLARRLGDGRLPALPLAAGAGLATMAVALLEMPLTAWLVARADIDTIGVGSIVASLETPVRAIVHTVATVLALAGALLLAALQRPDWFERRPRPPVATIRPKRARTGQGATAPA